MNERLVIDPRGEENLKKKVEELTKQVKKMEHVLFQLGGGLIEVNQKFEANIKDIAKIWTKLKAAEEIKDDN